jgi:GrpB-like predicted nucleotidyltransferase (UPF0157 family)
MQPMISLCGDDCSLCPRHTARTAAELSRVAELWRKLGWRDATSNPRTLACKGCAPGCACSGGACTFGLWECAHDRDLASCHECAEWPCEKVAVADDDTPVRREAFRKAARPEEFCALDLAFCRKRKHVFSQLSLERLWQLFPIELAEPNTAWPAWYEEETHKLADLLGDEVVRMSHIGSTSVDGLVAKPIVDILLELAPGYDMDEAIALLEGADWVVMCRDDANHMIDLNRGYTLRGFAERVFHLHVREPGDWDELVFRDRLRTHAQVAADYVTLKRGLAAQYEHDRDAYTDAKGAFVREQVVLARQGR